MAASMIGIVDEAVRDKISQSQVLVVGAGGIGCELLKNLVLSGFVNIELIDLDTIDVSNLNRQFLFRKEHVGKSKAKVAQESATQFNPDANIKYYHDNIMSSDYGVNFFKKFDVVMNALDNKSARNHVNRMCLAADKPLVESGSAGYLGQVSVIKKGKTECYECQPKPAQKTYPGCTIRNTPSEPIHCIVWAKHLFNQLFGEEDPDQDVSPDTEDPELAGEAGQKALTSIEENSHKEMERKSTRGWAADTDYNGEKLFNKLFRDDIKYLLSMETLWKKRRPPEPLDWTELSTIDSNGISDGEAPEAGIRDQRIWSTKECADIFERCLQHLKVELKKQGDGGMLVWDKDDEVAMDFVTCVANLRSHIFGIPVKSRFDTKSMAGNIIPAIATTNAIIAGLIVLEGIKILAGEIDKCKQVYLNRQPNPKKKLVVPCCLDPPNPRCYVCSSKPELTVVLNTEKTSVRFFQDKVIKGYIGMVAPDVEIDDGKGTIMISSEEGETDENADKFLNEFGIKDGSRLKCDDFLSTYALNITIAHVEKLPDSDFEVVGDLAELQSKQEEQSSTDKVNDKENGTIENKIIEEEDDLILMDDCDDDEPGTSDQHLSKKRKLSTEEESQPPKKLKVNVTESEQTDEIMVID